MTTYFNIASELNDFVLDIQYGNMIQGTPVIMHPFKGGPHQLWNHDIDTGAVHSKKNRDFVLDIENNKMVINRYVKGKVTQRFGLGPKHIYLLTDKYKVLDVEASNREPMAPVILYSFKPESTPNQSWKYNNVLADN